MTEIATAATPEDDFNSRLHDPELIKSYTGQMSATASHRSFLDIEPNISVRPEMNRRDYYRFRPGEAIPDDSKHSIKMCLDAYEKVGIVKNVIDLMGDFASQGITLNHPNKEAQKFYRSWWKAVNGTERSERFLNTLYRAGNVIVKRRYAKPSKKMRNQMAKAFKATAFDTVELEALETQKNVLPFKYDILNPCQVTTKGGVAGVFFGKPIYEFNISALVSSNLKDEKNADILKTLPESIRKAVQDGTNKIPLDPKNILVYHYKKDDWQLWANPMIYAILDDLVFFEKMKLADMAALDGAISQIRLWKLGSLEHKIMPNKGAVDKLRDILASNPGGGVMDLVWGPELEFQESNSQIYRFLGDQKYIPVLNSIYAGLGIPPTLTGLAGQSGGYTNNFISLKTLIDRLKYGRSLLEDFWNREIKIVQKAMGFRLPAKLHFDTMLSQDETAEKNLLMALADRGIISTETLRDRLGEDNDLENTRTKSEHNKRKNGTLPPKADPFHNANVESELIKIALQKGLVGVKDVTDVDPKFAPPINDFTKKPSAPNGRPKFKQDTQPRKQRIPKPKTSPKMTRAIMWANKAQKTISDMILPSLLAHFKKANLRDLTKDERKTINEVMINILSNLEMNDINAETILAANTKINPRFATNLDKLIAEFLAENSISPSIDEMRQLLSVAYALTVCE